jgi:hypothetical protein
MRTLALKTLAVRLIAGTLSVPTALIPTLRSADAACADMWVAKFTGSQPTRCPRGVSACTDGSDGRPAVFHAGDQFTLCVKLPYEAYITLWDAAPNGGSVHRLYPNPLTHRNNATVLGEKLAGASEHCFGYRDFSLYFPRSKGLGEGKLSLIATPKLEDQPTPSEMTVPGQEMARPRHETLAKVLNAANDCHEPYSHWIVYNVID